MENSHVVHMPKIGTPEHVTFFEEEQKKYGTKVAINNLIFQIADNLLKAQGVKKLTVEWEKEDK